MQELSDLYGPYALWEADGRFGAEFRFIDETAHPSNPVHIRIPTGSFTLTDAARDRMHMEIAAYLKPGTTLVQDGGEWRLRRL